MTRTIRNWTDATELEIRLSTSESPIVIITADSGPLRLHFGMTAKQTRDMAQMLNEAAAEIEALQVAA